MGAEGEFDLRVERLLKQRGTNVQQGQIVGGPVLGRARPYDQVSVIPEIGWPLLLDPQTYPSASEIPDRPWHPRLCRQPSWSRGDRCLVFYGKDCRRPLQVINLDKPVTIEVKFLAVDLAGQTVTQANALIDLIKHRVATTQTSDGQPRVRSAGISYEPPKSPLDGQDYYYVLAPPEKRLAQLWKPEILQKPERFQCDPYTTSRSGHERLATRAAWFWYFSGKTASDYASYAREERNRAVRGLFRDERAEQDIRRRLFRPGGVGFHLSGRHHRRLLSYRNYPYGVRCRRTYDQSYIAMQNGRYLEVWSVNFPERKVDEEIFRRRDAHWEYTEMEFSFDSRMFAYTTAAGAVSLNDLKERKLRWIKAATNLQTKELTHSLARKGQLEFSRDNKYLAQQVGVNVHVWEVESGRLALTTFSERPRRFEYVAFHPENSSLIRVRTANDGQRVNEIWDVNSGRRIAIIPVNGEWPEL